MIEEPDFSPPWDPTDFLAQYYATRFDPSIEIGSERAQLAAEITAILVRDNLNFAGVSSLEIRRDAVGRKLVEIIEAGDFATFQWIGERLEYGLNASVEIVALMSLIDRKDGELPTIKEWQAERERRNGGRPVGSDKTEAAFRKRLMIDLRQARGGNRGFRVCGTARKK